MKLISMTFRKRGLDEWELAVLKEGFDPEIVISDLSEIQEAFVTIYEFSNNLQSAEERAKQEGEQKVLDLLTVITNTTTDEEKLKLIEAYPEYQNDKQYSKDDPVPYVRFSGKLYKIISAAFTSQSEWTPDVAASLFVEVLPPGSIGEWKQPTGAHDAYQIGDRVIFEGWIWCSIIDNNTWSPTAYPQGWEKEREV